jgi:hypothetical protein
MRGCCRTGYEFPARLFPGFGVINRRVVFVGRNFWMLFVPKFGSRKWNQQVFETFECKHNRPGNNPENYN